MTLDRTNPRRRLAAARASTLPLLLEEYRQLYDLIRFRLEALDRRTPIAGATLVAGLVGASSVGLTAQLTLLAAIPLSLLWWLATTINHARSFEDALRRVEAIEREINRLAGRPVLIFQSSHPSRGKRVGGRTGEHAVQAVLAASAVLLGGCLTIASELPMHAYAKSGYASAIAVLAGLLLGMFARLRLYRYSPKVL